MRRLAPVVISQAIQLFKVKLRARGVDEVSHESPSPQNQPLGDMVPGSARRQPVIPLPYLIEKQRYNLTVRNRQRLPL